MKNKVNALATVAALGAQIIFGFSFMFTKIALSSATPLIVIADRFIVAFLGMSLVMLLTGKKLQLNKNIWKLLVMSAFQPLLYFVFESYGIQMTTSTFSSIMISMIPVVSMVSGIFILKEIPSLLQYFFTALSVGGVVIVALAGKADGTVSIAGILLLLGAVISSVGYNIASRAFSAEFTAFERTYAMMFIGAASFTLIALFENMGTPVAVFTSFLDFKYTFSILYLGIMSSIVAFLFLNFANTHLPVTKTTVFANITTVVSVLAGVFLLNEKLSAASAVASCMIVAGVLGVQLSGIKNNR